MNSHSLSPLSSWWNELEAIQLIPCTQPLMNKQKQQFRIYATLETRFLLSYMAFANHGCGTALFDPTTERMTVARNRPRFLIPTETP